MENERVLRQTLRRPKTDEEIFDRVTPAKHSRSTSLLDIHNSRGVHQDRDLSGEHDTRAQEQASTSLGSQQPESESESEEPFLARGRQRSPMAPQNLRSGSGSSQASELSTACMNSILDDYLITPFLDADWSEQLTQWDSSVNRHARFASDMESSPDNEKHGPKVTKNPKPLSWSTNLSVSEKFELLDEVGDKVKRNEDESEPRYLNRIMDLLQLTPKEKEHARALLIARQDFDQEEDEILGHYRLEMHTTLLKDPRATIKMTSEDKEKMLEKHTGRVIATAQAKSASPDKKKVDAYWKYCGLDKKSWSLQGATDGPSHPPSRKRKGSLGEDEYETYTKAFAAQRQNAARFQGKPLAMPEKNPNMYRRFNSSSPDYLSHMYALRAGYNHKSQHTPQVSSGCPHVRTRSLQRGSSTSGSGGSHESDFSSAVRSDRFMQRSHPPSDRAQRTSSTTTTNTTSGSYDHQHPKPSASSSRPRPTVLSGDASAANRPSGPAANGRPGWTRPSA